MRLGKNAAAPPAAVAGEIVDNDPLGVNEPAQPVTDPGTAIALIPQLQAIVPSEFFKPNASEAVIAALEAEVRRLAADLDISTPERRAALKSLGYKVARTKTGLDRARKDLVADKKAEVKAIDTEGGRIWDRLEALQKEILAPLNAWEQANKDRVDAHEAAIVRIEELGNTAAGVGVTVLGQRIAAVRDIAARDWQEFRTRAERTTSLALAKLGEALQVAEQAEADAAELRRLRAEQRQREEQEREQRIRDEAAAAERERQETIAREQREASERERQRIKNERNEADARARAEEQRRLEAERLATEERERAARALREAEERSAREAREAADKADREREAAVKAERNRIEAEQADRERLQAEHAEQERRDRVTREKNKKHRAAIDAQVIEDLVKLGIGGAEPAVLIVAVASGLVRHMTIDYSGGAR